MDDDTILLDDRFIYWGVVSTVCSYCRHLIMDDFIEMENVDEGFTRFICKAYHKGIPEKIWLGRHKHKRPFRGDGGIRFEKEID